jgi:Glucose / Sorbosone dehydrogenase
MMPTKTNQRFSPKERFATGLRNSEGFDFDADARLFVTQHGRDQLHEDWPELYTAEQGQEQPAEEVVILKDGADYGWPQCYYDGQSQKLVLTPEYGGDGGKKVGACTEKQPPVAAFPAHWAPNDLKIYKGTQFPQAYRGGALIAFHGSWNRAPGPQGGYNIVFQPLTNGKPSGDYIIFADGFAGGFKDPGKAAHRPSGLTVGPDGALYVTDDVKGRIWRITFTVIPIRRDWKRRRRRNRARPQAHRPQRHQKEFIPMLAMRRGAFRRRRVQHRSKWPSASGSSTARWEVLRAPGVTAPTPSARRSGPSSPAANGCGAMVALRASRRP